MKAQTIYNLREEYGFCSGSDLHKFFSLQVGDSSPCGCVDVPTEAAKQFMIAGIENQYYPGNSAVGDAWRNAALDAVNAI